ncbi:MAG: alkaline phosphatase D family protein, partial [Candidatus Tectomicrobia bacterium]|nr:alkaline phosphatase D family protein [Candidatus Tectomicrobia bacterium]
MRNPPNPWEVYRKHWDPRGRAGYFRFLAATPTGYLADDHEYWNDFPHKSIWLTWTGGGMSNPVGRAADEAFELYQAALNPAPGEEGSLPLAARQFCRSFQFAVPPLSFFVLDSRTGRTFYTDKNPGFIRQTLRPGTRLPGAGQAAGAKPELDALRAWVQGLEGPGILIVSQPLVETPASSFTRFFHSMGDLNLPDYGRDYLDVWQAILRSSHNVLVLTGDIHCSRLTRVQPVGVPGASG